MSSRLWKWEHVGWLSSASPQSSRRSKISPSLVCRARIDCQNLFVARYRGNSVRQMAITVPVEPYLPVYGSWRLGVCLTAQEKQAAVLAGHALTLLRLARGEARRSRQTCLVSHLPAHFRNAPQCQRGECEGRAGASASLQYEGHDRRLHADGQFSETGGAEQAGEDGPERSGFSGLSGPYWTMTENVGIAEVLQNVGVPGGIRTRVTAVKGRCPRPG